MRWNDPQHERRQLPPNWKRIRRQVLERDGGQCVAIEHGTRCPNPATDVDHIADRDDHRPEALQSLCATHHKRKTQAEAQQARQRRKRTNGKHPGVL